jgi:transcription initiation factor IIE alpha subunit
MSRSLPCPRCHAPSSFATYTEHQGDGVLWVYWRCSRCNWNEKLRESTPEQEAIRADIERLKLKIAAAPPEQAAQLAMTLRSRLDRLR